MHLQPLLALPVGKAGFRPHAQRHAAVDLAPDSYGSIVTDERRLQPAPTRFRRNTVGVGQYPSAPMPNRRTVPISRSMTDLTVWHDGACPLCQREIALMRRLDRRGTIRFVDASTADMASCPIDRAALLARFHACEDGTMLHGAAAFAAMWRAIPVLRPMGLAARSPWVLAALERLYGAFLKVRPSLQRLARQVAA